VSIVLSKLSCSNKANLITGFMKNSKIILYSLPIFGGGFMNFLITNFLLKYTTDVLLIAPAILGSILFTARIWDAINDPIIGHLSDITISKMGKRKSWIILSSLPLVISFILVWQDPFNHSTLSIVWLTIILFIFFTLITALYVPHYSLGADLTKSYNERNKIFAIRSLVENIGVIIAVLFTAKLEKNLISSGNLLFGGSIIFALVFLILVFWFSKSIDEKATSYKVKGKTSLFISFSHVLKNKNTRYVLLGTLCTQFASTIIMVMAPFYAPLVLGQKVGSILVAVFMIGALLSTLLWPLLGKTLEKKQIWQICTFVLSLGFTYFLFATTFSIVLTYIICFILGSFAGGILIILPSMIADCIDEDEAKHHQRKEGIFYSVFTFVNKTGMGFASALAGFILYFSLYNSKLSIQSQSTIDIIKIFYALTPMLLFLGGFISMKKYSLSQKNHKKILTKLS